MKSLLFGLALFVPPSLALAADESNSMEASARITGSCVVHAPAILDFGGYDPTGAHKTVALTAPLVLGLQCTRGTPATVLYIDKGKYDQSGCSDSVRRLKGVDTANLANYLSYTIEKGAAGDEGWGCAAGAVPNGGQLVGPFTDNAAILNVSARATISAGQVSAVVGEYTDVLNVYVTF